MDGTGRAGALSIWLGFVAAIWVQSISGNNYTFANYSADLKRVLNYTQVELDGLGVAKDIGKSVGLLAGFLADFLPPSVILIIGATVGFLGYGSTWLVVSQRIAPPSFWQMSAIVFMSGNSSTWMNTAVLVTCMRNFPWSRGTVSGILKGFVGLSTAIFTVLCASLFTGDASSFLLILALLPLGICLVAAIFLKEEPNAADPSDSNGEASGFMTINAIAMGLAVYLLAYTVFGNSFSATASKVFATGLVLFLLSPLYVPGRVALIGWGRTQSSELSGKADLTAGDEGKQPLLGNDTERNQGTEDEHPTLAAGTTDSDLSPVKVEAGQSDKVEHRTPELGDNYSLAEILASLDFWVLFLTFLSAIGTGMTVINNLGQMGESLGHSDVTMFVSFFSVFGFFGRIGAGAVSEHYARSAAVPRPVWMAISKVVMILGYLSLAWGIPGSLQLGSVVVGMCYGIHMTIVVATSSEMFGLRSFGITYNILVLTIPLGSFLFSGLLAGFLYDREATKYGKLRQEQYLSGYLSEMTTTSIALPKEARSCYGSHCFRTIFITMTMVLAVGLVLDLVLIFRLRPVFQKLHAQRRAQRVAARR